MDTGPDAQVQDLTGCLGSNPSPALCQGHTLGNHLSSLCLRLLIWKKGRPHT